MYKDPILAIITTLSKFSLEVNSFISYHLTIGFDYIILFFDDPSTDIPEIIANNNKIIIYKRNTKLVKLWQKSAGYQSQFQFIDEEVMSRQILNVEIAVKLCQKKGINWLLHIDIDEIFYAPDMDAKSHFKELEKLNIGAMQYINYECVHDKFHVENYIRDVVYFKINFKHLSKTQNDFIKSYKKFNSGTQYFLLYSGIKSSVRINSSVRPDGVHRFFTSELEAITYYPIILHYPVCGFSNFWEKYKRLGNFKDTWFNRYDIGIPFHLKARNIVNENNIELAKKFYMKEVIFDSNDFMFCEAFGVLTKIDAPSVLIYKHESQ